MPIMPSVTTKGMTRRLVMLFAVITCVSARCSFARAAASSAFSPSSAIHGSIHASDGIV